MSDKHLLHQQSISPTQFPQRIVLFCLCFSIACILSQSALASGKINYKIEKLRYSYHLDTLALSFNMQINVSQCDSIFIYPYETSEIKHFELAIGGNRYSRKIYPYPQQLSGSPAPTVISQSETLKISFDECLKMPVFDYYIHGVRHLDSVRFRGFFLVCFPKSDNGESYGSASDGAASAPSMTPIYQWVWLKKQLMWGTYGASFGYHRTDVKDFAGTRQPQGLDMGFRIALDFRYLGFMMQANGSGFKNSDLDWVRMRPYARIPIKSFIEARHLRLLLGEELNFYTVSGAGDSSASEKNYTTVVGLQYDTPTMRLTYTAHFINNGGHSISLDINSDMRQSLESGTRITIDYLKRVQQLRVEWYINFMPDQKYGLRYADNRPQALKTLAKLASYPFYPVKLIVRLFTDDSKKRLNGTLER